MDISLNEFAKNHNMTIEETKVYMANDDKFFNSWSTEIDGQLFLHNKAVDKLEGIISKKNNIEIPLKVISKALNIDTKVIYDSIDFDDASISMHVVKGANSSGADTFVRAKILGNVLNKLMDSQSSSIDTDDFLASLNMDAGLSAYDPTPVKEEIKNEVKEEVVEEVKGEVNETADNVSFMSAPITEEEDTVTTDEENETSNDDTQNDDTDKEEVVEEKKKRKYTKRTTSTDNKPKKRRKKSQYAITKSFIAENGFSEDTDIKKIRMFLISVGDFKLEEIAFMNDEEVTDFFKVRYFVLQTANNTVILPRESIYSIIDDINVIPNE